MQQPMYLPNGYMMTYYPQMPPSNMPVYGMENGIQGRTTSGLFESSVSSAMLLQKPLLVPNATSLPNAQSWSVHIIQGCCKFTLLSEAMSVLDERLQSTPPSVTYIDALSKCKCSD